MPCEPQSLKTIVAIVAGIVLLDSGCGDQMTSWPNCLRTAGVQHVRVATPRDLRQIPRPFAVRRAAALDFADGAKATLVVARTARNAAVVRLALATNTRVFPPPRTPHLKFPPI